MAERRRRDSTRGPKGPPRKAGNRARRARSGRETRTDKPHPTDGARKAPSIEPVHLSDEIVRELKSTARPGKGEILVKVFGEAAGAFAVDDYDEAVRLGEQAKHIALRSATVRELLGLAYYRLEQWKEAARELAAFRRLAGSTEQNPVIADCYRAVGRPERALEICDEIDAGKVDEAIVYEGAIVAAGALTDMRRIDDAIERLQRLDLRPRNAQEHHLRAWYVLGDLLERKGRFTQAREWFAAAASANPEATDAPERARRLQGR